MATNRIVVTVTGANRAGIVASISLAIARCGGNIQDITQRIQGEFFVMLMVVDLGDVGVGFEEFQAVLQRLGQELSLQISVQHEDVFKYMHRLTR